MDDYVAGVQRAVESLRQENQTLGAQLQRLLEQVSETEAKFERLRTAGLDERAQDVLTAADEQAAQIVAEGEQAAAAILRQAHRDADVVMERSRQELAWGRRQLRTERAELDRQRQALPPARHQDAALADGPPDDPGAGPNAAETPVPANADTETAGRQPG